MFHIMLSRNPSISKTVTCFTATLLLFSAPSGAEIYKCFDEHGRPQFSDRPCAEDAETVDVKVHSSGISHGPQGDFSKVKRDRELRDMERKIERKEDEIEAIQSARDTKIAQLRSKRRYANNNLAGATWEQSIATEISAVTQDYNSRIELVQDEIRDLREDIRALKRPSD